MVRYVAGELRLPTGDVDRALRGLTEYLETQSDAGEGDVDLQAAVRWIVERTMLPPGQVERAIMAMLDLSARLDQALDPRLKERER